MSIGVRDRNVTWKKVKSERFHRRQITHGAVGDISHAVQRKPDVCMDLADKRSQAWYMIYVFQNHDPRLRQSSEVLPEIHPIVVASAAHGWAGAPDPAGNRITQHRAKVLKTATQSARNKSLVSEPHIQPLYGVGHRASIQSLQLVKDGVRYGCALGHMVRQHALDGHN